MLCGVKSGLVGRKQQYFKKSTLGERFRWMGAGGIENVHHAKK